VAVAAATVADDARAALLADLLGRVAGCFPRRETRQRCGQMVSGLPDARSRAQLALRLRNRSLAVVPGVIEPALDPVGGEVGLVGGDQL